MRIPPAERKGHYHEKRGYDPIDKDTEQDLDPDITLSEGEM